MSVKSLFDFITDPTVTEDNMDSYLDAISEQMTQENDQEFDPTQQIEDQVFKQAYIPQNLTQVFYRTVEYVHMRNMLYMRTCICILIFAGINFNISVFR